MNSQHRQHISIEVDPDLPLKYIHGVFGGANQLGEIELNLYTEAEDMPTATELTVTQDGQLLNETPLEGDGVFKLIRTVHTRAVIDSYNARVLANWLLTQADKVDRGDTEYNTVEFGDALAAHMD